MTITEHEILNQMKKMAAELEKCSLTYCTAQMKKGEKQKLMAKKHMQQLKTQLLANKINKHTYLQEVGKYMEYLKNTETTIELMKCNLAKCQSQIKGVLQLMLEVHAHNCDLGLKQACDKKVILTNGLKSKKISPKTYINGL